jgi:pSer/pThr/pTyr-binding forkhead associated (FHA) protein
MNKNRYYDPFEFVNYNNLDNSKVNIPQSTVTAPTEPVKSSSAKRVYLIKKNNGEKIVINKPSFVIGKGNGCDYVITGNSAISRKHAELRIEKGSVYIVDKKSTNKTYINGNVIQPEIMTKINNGDNIKAANEEFLLSIE